MIKHVFMFTLSDDDADTLARVRAEIEALRGLPMVRDLEVGIDVGRTRMSYDAVALVSFDDRAGLAAYEADPAHKRAVSLLRELCDRVAIVDYESP